jgi:hypothetical protein
MVKLIGLWLVLSIPLIAEMNFLIGGNGGSEKILTQNKKKDYEYVMNSEQVYFFNPKINYKQNSINANLDLIFAIKNSNESGKFFAGKNFYIGTSYSNLSLYLGKKLFNSNNDFDSKMDGLEGINIEYYFNDNLFISITPFDLYSGYSLYTNQIFLQKDNRIEKGNRNRQTIELQTKYKFHQLLFKISYFQLGNWGKFSKDRVWQNSSGDEDFIYSIDTVYRLNSYYIDLILGGYFCRGIDKTIYNEVRKTSFIPITGEALQANLILKYRNWKYSIFFFLPDTNTLNSQNELLQYGYIGTGSGVLESYFLNQILDIYPSAWITNKGLESNEQIINSRFNSLLFKNYVKFDFKQFSTKLFYEYLLPYNNNIQNKNGTISFKKSDFSHSFVSELNIKFRYENIPYNTFFCEFTISKLFASKDMNLKGESFVLSGGLYF